MEALKLLPVEPDDAMIEAGEEEIASRGSLGCAIYASDVYEAMVRAYEPEPDVSSTDPRPTAQPVAWLVSCPDDEIYGRGPDKLQFHPLAQHDIDNGYRAKPLYATPQPLAEGEPSEVEVERAAKAAYEKFIEDVRDLEPSWEALPQSHRDRMIGSQRAALLAAKSKGGQADG